MSSLRLLHAIPRCALALALLWPQGALAQAQGSGDASTLLIDRGSTGTTSPGGGSATQAQSDPFTGAATLGFELQVPPGTGGMQPQLALAYNNQRRADSWVGYGWSLSLGSIRRSLKRGVPTYDDDVDRFELEGQELVPDPDVPGRFHTRRESFLRIDRLPSGAWEVRSKDGRITRFGTSEAARISRPDGAVYEWLFSETEDLRGNALAVTYDRRDTGTAYPEEIRYTLRRQGERLASMGGPASERLVRFVTEERPDAFQGRIKGLLEEQHRRLSHVLLLAGGELVRRYDLRYEQSPDSMRSLLAEITERGSDAGTDADPREGVHRSTLFAYHSNVTARTQGWELARGWSVPGTFVTGQFQDGGARLADVNGDALPDLVVAKRMGAELPDADTVMDDDSELTPDSGVYLNTGSSFASSPSPDFPIPPRNFFVSVPRGGGPRGSFGTVLADLSGDGRAELLTAPRFFEGDAGVPPIAVGSRPLQIYAANTGRGWQVLSGPDGNPLAEPFGRASTASLARGSATAGNPSGTFDGSLNLLELNGDGFPDLLGDQIIGRVGQDEGAVQRIKFVALNRRGNRGFEFLSSEEPFLLCPDGTPTDFTVRGPCLFDAISSLLFFGAPDGASPLRVFENSRFGARFFDLDGDGLDDQIRAIAVEGLEPQVRVGRRSFLNTGSAFVQDDRWDIPPLVDLTWVNSVLAPGFVNMARDQGSRFFDINGDGRTDIVRRVAGRADFTNVWLNSGFPEPADQGAPWIEQPTGSPLQIPNNLAFIDAQGRDRGVRVADLNGDGMPDLIQASGNRGQVFLNRGSVPDQLTTITNPLGGVMRIEYAPSTRFDNTGEDELPDLPQVVQVVSAIQTEDGVGDPSRTTMDYAGGRFDTTEREFRGFAKVTARRPDGRTTVSEFHQDVERAGLVKRVEVQDADGRRLTATEMTYTDDDVPGEPFARLPASVTSSEDPAPGASGPPRRTRMDIRYERTRDGRFRFGRVAAMIEFGEVDEGGNDLDPTDTRTSEIEYATNEASYLVELPRSQVLRGGLPGSGTVLRESRFFYDGDTSGTAVPRLGLLTRKTEMALEQGTANPTTTFDHDEFGNVTAVVDPRANANQGGGTTRFTFDPTFHSFMVSSTNAQGHTTRLAYEPTAGCAGSPPFGSGLLYAEQGPNNTEQTRSRFCYDALGRPTLETGPGDLSELRTSYVDTPGAVTVTTAVRATVDGGVRTSVRALDGFGRTLSLTTDGPGRSAVIEEQSYDALGRVASASPPRFTSGTSHPTTTFLYDALDRMVRVERPGEGRITTFAFDRGRVTTTTPSGTRTRVLDPFGRVVEVQEFLDGQALTSSYRYRPSGELTRYEDAEGNTTTLTYDGLGRRRTIADPDTGMTRTEYDAGGNIIASRDPAGLVEFKYDAIGRLLERKVNAQVESSFDYDSAENGIGLLAQRTDRAGAFTVQTYDLLGRALDATRTADGTAHRFQVRFDPLGQVLERTLPNGRHLAFASDARGYLTQVASGGEPLIRDIQIEADGRPRAWSAASGVETRFGYDSATRRLETLQVGARTSLEAREFQYDSADRIRLITDSLEPTRNQAFEYDQLDRLQTATGPYAPGLERQTLHYRYGPTGNLLCLAATLESDTGCEGGRSMTYPLGGPGVVRPHAPSSVNGQPIAYADSGQLLQLGEQRRYEYDPLGQLSAAFEADRPLASFTYDGRGVRVKTVEAPGQDEVVRYQLSDDFEWNATRGTAITYVRVLGQLAAAVTEPYRPGSQRAASADPLTMGTSAWLGWLWAVTLLAVAATLLTLALIRRRSQGLPLPRAALSASASWLLVFSLVPGSVWAAPLDGDLNADGRLDMADALLAMRFASGLEIPTHAQLESGDVAPLELAPEAPSRIDMGDALLLMRAASGEDVDGDGLTSTDELEAGASPFRKDTDRDGLSDAEEIAAGRNPARDDRGILSHRPSPRLRVDSEAIPAESSADPTTRFFHPDSLGSTVLVTDIDGQIVSRTIYRPYGQAVDPAPGTPARVSDFGFTSQRFEMALGIYDYRARFYDPSLGRFIQPDSIVPELTDPQSFNRYAYVRNDPINRLDPSGNFDFDFGLGSLGNGLLNGALVGASVGLLLGLAPALAVPTAIAAGALLIGSELTSDFAFSRSLIQLGSNAFNGTLTDSDLSLAGNLIGGLAGGFVGVLAGGTTRAAASSLRAATRARSVTITTEDAGAAASASSRTGSLSGSLRGLTPAERSTVNELLAEGRNVSIVPRGSGKTPDFLVDGVSTELKTITRLGTNTVKNAIQTASRQGEQILIDARATTLTPSQATSEILRAQGNLGSLSGRVTILTQKGKVTF